MTVPTTLDHLPVVDWTEETMSCSCGWHEQTNIGRTPEERWVEHLTEQVKARTDELLGALAETFSQDAVLPESIVAEMVGVEAALAEATERAKKVTATVAALTDHTTVLGSIVPGPRHDPVVPDYSFLDDDVPSRQDAVHLSIVETDEPAVDPANTVKQHSYAPGGTFELRMMKTTDPAAAGFPFPPHIVYVDRDEQGRRRTCFVANVHENAIAHAAALVGSGI